MKEIIPSDLCITTDPVPVQILDKIYKFFVKPLNKAQEALGIQIKISQKSGFRPYWYEKARGRSGGSQHTFGQREKIILKNQDGAADITCEDFEKNKWKLLQALVDNTPYLRFAMYKTFIHADLRDLKQGRKRLFTSTSNSVWTFEKYL